MLLRGSNLRLVRDSNLSGANKNKEFRSSKLNNGVKINRQSKNQSHQHDNKDNATAAHKVCT